MIWENRYRNRNRFLICCGMALMIIISARVYGEDETVSSESSLPATAVPQIYSKIGGIPVVIDGNDNEWISHRTVIINEYTAAGVSRDQDFLYVHFITSDTEFSMQIMIYGMTVWIDPDGSQNKVIGVQFPVLSMQPPPPRDQKPPMGEELKKLLDERLKDLNVINTRKRDIKVMTVDWAKERFGIEAGISVTNGYLCYEMKYPLIVSGDDVIDMDLSSVKQIGICFETPEIDFHRIMSKYGKLQDEGGEQNTDTRNKRPSRQHNGGTQPGFPPGGEAGEPGRGFGMGQNHHPPGSGSQPPGPPGSVEPPSEGQGDDLMPVPENKEIGTPPQVNRINQWVKIYFQNQ